MGSSPPLPRVMVEGARGSRVRGEAGPLRQGEGGHGGAAVHPGERSAQGGARTEGMETQVIGSGRVFTLSFPC